MRRGEKVVGIIGGMGPEATVEFMRRIVAKTPAHDDRDHLRILVDNNPKIPSRIAALIEGTGEDPSPVLCEMARGLERQGADFLVVPCNTAHHYLGEITNCVQIPVLDMVDLAVQKLLAVQQKPRQIGMLASPAVRLVGLYDKRLERAGLNAIYPSQQQESELLAIIRSVKAGQLNAGHQKDYAKVAQGIESDGADAFLIACTELSVLQPPEGVASPIFDTLDVLVDATIATAIN